MCFWVRNKFLVEVQLRNVTTWVGDHERILCVCKTVRDNQLVAEANIPQCNVGAKRSKDTKNLIFLHLPLITIKNKHQLIGTRRDS